MAGYGATGRLVYVMGASGVGKDSLLSAARHRHPEWPVAHRYITRASGDSEDCVSLSHAEFAWRRRAGLFCLDWQAHGLDYALGVEVRAWLDRGTTVLVNGSRRALPLAQARFSEYLLPVLVTARPEVLRERLLQRGRESREEVEARLERHRQLGDACPGVPRLDNSGSLESTLMTLEAWLAVECVS
ncbi:phosphonate metabolism protein/1,5-bisphosphokinase (PRPP-forming) PhnN [Halomonas salipaludis]|uniref:Ribose 1,5-bisphosphate phosphokinase PhnN n=1 Tax=Halomonas salipaludis TaxID=2032625 RepID=A0A2A2EV45_9GAMM|nr:phosphonate metabolism protein/1,5-bisphosphokinase (PRPP-forming) PhnN [Halomonas salipaludis]PAU77291.1 ribose 1,5-bisphosphokinase [Halomonas salipaludis]